MVDFSGPRPGRDMRVVVPRSDADESSSISLVATGDVPFETGCDAPRPPSGERHGGRPCREIIVIAFARKLYPRKVSDTANRASRSA
jgi:hypothetical protein